jgi:hypothetical protein
MELEVKSLCLSKHHAIKIYRGVELGGNMPQHPLDRNEEKDVLPVE